MICVSIGEQSVEKLLQTIHGVTDRGAQLVEIRFDWLAEPFDARQILAACEVPVIATARREADKGHWSESESERLALLQTVIDLGVDYVDLELDVASQFPRKGNTQRIVSHHDFESTPQDLEETHALLCAADADVAKIVTMANSPLDSIRMLQLVDQAETPTAGFCMGEFGVLSRILCGRYGSPFTYATVDRSSGTAPGQLTWDEMRDLYRFDEITRATKLFGVLGDPIGHSLSPLIHNTAFIEESFDGAYLPLRVRDNELLGFLQAADWLGIRGYSVTIPHKQQVMEFANRCDESVTAIGAANTLTYDQSGEWRATNTDYQAALDSLQSVLDKPEPGKFLRDRRVLMLGAGGVARAIGLGVLSQGGALTITNRTSSRAEKLADELNVPTLIWDDRGKEKFDIIINCTSVGMSPNIDESPFPPDALQPGMVVFDTVYNPQWTQLLRDAQSAGCTTVSGLEMFVRQAALQFELFTEKAAPMNFMRSIVKQHLSGD